MDERLLSAAYQRLPCELCGQPVRVLGDESPIHWGCSIVEQQRKLAHSAGDTNGNG